MKRKIFALAVLSLAWLTPAEAAAPDLSMSIKLEMITPIQSKAYAKHYLKTQGMSPKEYSCLRSLWTKESNWRHNARNTIPVTQKGKKLYAFGIAQRLGETSSDYRIQIKYGVKYIVHRYDTPCKAWAKWQARDRRGTGWY